MWDSAKPEVLDRRQLTVIRKNHGIVIEDCFNKVKLIKKPNAQSRYFLLELDNMQAGTYNLFLRGRQVDFSIEITVHEGKMLQNMENIMLKKHCLQEIVSVNKMVKIRESQVTSDFVLLQLADFSKNTRVHMIATNYVPTNYDGQYYDMMRLVQN